LQDGGEHTAHGGNGSDRPDPIEDRPHDHERPERKRYPDETDASRSQLRWGAEPSKRYQIERECNLKPGVIEPPPTGKLILRATAMLSRLRIAPGISSATLLEGRADNSLLLVSPESTDIARMEWSVSSTRSSKLFVVRRATFGLVSARGTSEVIRRPWIEIAYALPYT
jgi:hypothetical protein